MKTTSHMDFLPKSIDQLQMSRSPSPRTNLDSASTQNNINSNLSAILSAVKSNSMALINESKSGHSPSPRNESDTSEKDLDAQQKAFHRFTTSFNDLGFRSSFPVNVFPPFLAALQQNPVTLHHQLMNLGHDNSLGLSPGLDDDEDLENVGSTEPEDLTVGFRKEKKEGDDNADSDISGQQNWSYEEQFKQVFLIFSFKKNDYVLQIFLNCRN
ncbi:unnamed protein product [Dracunculus medinensis]|uniref:RPN13_C domain-containing protein n=1 Tax=Dracunculus medinensis TaxID=318479 RepID=A0A0N4UB61_DRAME|nr:unnamed protein product [Dracunculus medinensis]